MLFPYSVRDLLVELATTEIFAARWTEQINDEWVRAVLERYPHYNPERLQRTRDRMRDAVRDCIVESYESLIPSIQLRDEDDRHVVAAAIMAGADAIITYNLGDFPSEALAPYDIEAKHPDEFLMDVVALEPQAVLAAVADILDRLNAPFISLANLLARYRANGLHRFADWVAYMALEDDGRTIDPSRLTG